MELRWLKGNWSFGKFKLQYRIPMLPGGTHKCTNWIDVPMVDKLSEPSQELCHPPLHPEANIYGKRKCPVCENHYSEGPPKKNWWCEHTKPGTVIYVNRPQFANWDEWKFCPICGTPRPQPKSLAEKFREYFETKPVHPLSKYMDFESLAKVAEQHFKEIR